METAWHFEFPLVVPDPLWMALRLAMTRGRKIGAHACLALLGMLSVVTVSFAADFNCTRAGTAPEKAICADQDLSGLDEALGMAYRTALESAGDEAKAVREAQRTWLAERNACGAKTDCLRQSYDKRLSALLDQTDDNSGGPGDEKVLMRCDGQAETVSIRRSTYSDTHEPQQSVQVAKGEIETLVVSSSDQYAECKFASGMAVRVKVGDETLWPFGQCGADPGAFFSLWLNQVRVASRSYLYTACHAEELISAFVSRQGLRSCYKRDKSGCESTPFKNPLGSRDVEEYPDGPKPEPGSYVVEYAADAPLCKSMVRQEKLNNSMSPSWSIRPPSKASAYPLGEYYGDVASAPPTVDISEIDINNDGKTESVVSIRYGTKFRRSDTFLAQRSNAVEKAAGDKVDAEALRKHEKLLRKQTFMVFPHAWNGCKGGGDLDGMDDGDCRIPLKNFKPKGRLFAYDVSFLSLRPFWLDDTRQTYFLGVGQMLNEDYEQSRIVTVWKPQPSGAAQEICIFRRIVQNF